jgi:hypothetical protein
MSYIRKKNGKNLVVNKDGNNGAGSVRKPGSVADALSTPSKDSRSTPVDKTRSSERIANRMAMQPMANAEVLSQQYLLGRISGRGSFPPLPSLTEASA